MVVKPKIALQLAICCIISVIFFAHRPLQTAVKRGTEQREFDQWLAQLEQSYRVSNALDHQIEIRLKSTPADTMNSPEAALQMQLASSGSGSKTEQLLRLLQLAREANLFSAAATNEASQPGTLELEVIDGNRTFSAKFQQNELSSNVQASTLIKLFQLYSQSN